VGARGQVLSLLAAAALGAGVTGAALMPRADQPGNALAGTPGEAVYPRGLCTATDGDTIRCGSVRVRVAEIDAPEMPGHCRASRVCAPGDPILSRQSVAEYISAGEVRVRTLDVDRYGRVVGDVSVRGREPSLSCHQVATGRAIAQLKWGDHGVLRRCG